VQAGCCRLVNVGRHRRMPPSCRTGLVLIGTARFGDRALQCGAGRFAESACQFDEFLITEARRAPRKAERDERDGHLLTRRTRSPRRSEDRLSLDGFDRLTASKLGTLTRSTALRVILSLSKDEHVERASRLLHHSRNSGPNPNAATTPRSPASKLLHRSPNDVSPCRAASPAAGGWRRGRPNRRHIARGRSSAPGFAPPPRRRRWGRRDKVRRGSDTPRDSRR